MTTVKKIILLYSTLPITDSLTHWLTTLKYRATQLLLKYKSGALVTQWGNGERFTLYISSFSLYFLPLYPFPKPKIVSFCRKMLNMSLLSRMSQKNLSYALWENNSGSNSLRENSASCAGLMMVMVMNIRRSPVQPYVPQYVATVTQHFKWHPRQIKSFHINHPHRPNMRLTCFAT